jgi:uncharacterized protein YqjF (DUF2071 family)
MLMESTTTPPETALPSLEARARMRAHWGEPMFVAGWVETLMVHLEVDPDALQRVTPFALDRLEGRAYVSLVCFRLCRMRPRLGGRLGEWLMKPVGTHEFLNVRTYVKHRDEPGIYFLAEWLPNALSVALGPIVFGLPFHLGTLRYDHAADTGSLNGTVIDRATGGRLSYRGRCDTDTGFAPCVAGSRDEWLMERYTAFTDVGRGTGCFRVWHPPWPQVHAAVELTDDSLLASRWPWMAGAQIIGANYSPGFDDVWMGRPHRVAR